MRHVDLGKLVDDLEMVGGYGGARLWVGASSTLIAASEVKTTGQDGRSRLGSDVT